MRKRILLFLILAVLLTGCAPGKQIYQTVYLDVFDTVTTLRGYAPSEKEFNRIAEQIHTSLLEYHALFDIYHDCPSGIKTINDNAGRQSVQADPRVIALLKFCREVYDLTGGRVNPAMGSVLQLWHEVREAGLADPEHASLPDLHALQNAAQHICFDTVQIDEENRTVYIEDPLQRLDVGAIAKGWTAQEVSRMLPEGYLLNLGGNICAVGKKPDGSSWNIGIQDPDDTAKAICTVRLTDGSIVTSGDYQRFYTVDGKNYHHIIDPDTLMPSDYWRSVSILCPDSAMADCLSTALFLMPLEEGQLLAQQCGAEAMWIGQDRIAWQTNHFPINNP